MMQPSGFGRESSTLHLPSQRLCAYHLPDVYSDRKVSVQPYGSWAKSIPFHVDEVGAMTLAVKREHHLATLPHVVTRSAPEYSVSFPPREIGLYLETDFFDKRYVRVTCVQTAFVHNFYDQSTSVWLFFLTIFVITFPPQICYHVHSCLILFCSVLSPNFFTFFASLSSIFFNSFFILFFEILSYPCLTLLPFLFILRSHIVVKGFRADSWALLNTDIQVKPYNKIESKIHINFQVLKMWRSCIMCITFFCCNVKVRQNLIDCFVMKHILWCYKA
jgi:hypothetical protein